MTSARQQGGLRPVRIRPKVPKADYTDEISQEAFEELRSKVADLNDPKRKRTVVSTIGWPDCE
jgi:hypothetical protein